MDIRDWIKENGLDVKWHNSIAFSIGDENFLYLKDRDYLFDEYFQIFLESHEELMVRQNNFDYFAFKFGDRYYYSPVEADPPELNELRYIGKSVESDMSFPFLGVHGGYELCNGSRNYSDWVKKARFMGIETLGICEKNTLAGTLPFQIECEKNDIKSIIGEQITVRRGELRFDIKLYVLNKTGWQNLLKINKIINVDNEVQYIDESDLLKLTAGLVCVIPSKMKLTEMLVSRYTQNFHHVYYQFDPVIWRSVQRDKEHLNNLKMYVDNFSDRLKCVIIPDAYYLDKGDGHIKRKINVIGKVPSDYISYDQYFKSWDEVLGQIVPLFKESDKRLDRILENGLGVLSMIEEKAEYKIPLGQIHLPKYKMTEEESSQFSDNMELFWSVVEKGLETRSIDPDRMTEYIERIESEFDIINRGGFVDYFLILWDIVNWCDKQKIMVGVGRGSAGGSLIAYLMGVTQIDPMKYGLIFERFLNEGRIGKSLPDIDTDFMGERRDEVKQYMRDRYGAENVCSVGTYTTFAARGAVKDLARVKGLNFSEVNYVSGAMNKSYTNYRDVFMDAQLESKGGKWGLVKKFIHNNSDIFSDLCLVLNQPKTPSINAAGVIITPDEDEDGNPMTIYDWMPVKKMKGDLVSEWEKDELETAGFLKEDILGIKQLDKIDAIWRLVEKNGGRRLSFEEIQEKGFIDDKGVYELFSNGKNQDVFQFGSTGLTGYSKEVKPKSIEDLIAIVSLYRPGPMESNAHNDFVKIREGRKDPEYDYMLEEVTKDTGGLYIYQEQVMKACQVLGGFSLTEADGIRKAMGKKIKEKMVGYSEQFIKEAVNKGCPPDEARMIWEKMAVFAGYGFNKSHAAAYAITGYVSQYLKAHHPVEFWTVALEYADKDEIKDRINEIYALDSHIKLMTPDINESIGNFRPDFKELKIYWSLLSIPFIGEAALEAIIEERTKNGRFFSIEEFIERVPARAVKVTGLENLILAGAFDQIYNIDEPYKRFNIIKELFKVKGKDLPDQYIIDNNPDLVDNKFWILQQKDLIGLGYIDYSKQVLPYVDFPEDMYMEPDEMMYKGSLNKDAVMAGVVSEINIRKSKNGNFAKIKLDNNNKVFEVVIWNETWFQYAGSVGIAKGKIIVLNGRVKSGGLSDGEHQFQSHKDTKIEVL